MRSMTFEQLSQYVMGLSSFRADDRDEWIKVGMAIHSFDPSDAGLTLWERFSSQSEKYRDGECPSKWKGFVASKSRAVSIATITMMYKADRGPISRAAIAAQPTNKPTAVPVEKTKEATTNKLWATWEEAFAVFESCQPVSQVPQATEYFKAHYGIPADAFPGDWRVFSYKGDLGVIYRGMTTEIDPVFKFKTFKRFEKKDKKGNGTGVFKRDQKFLYNAGGAIEFIPKTPGNEWCVVCGEEKALAASIAGYHALAPLTGEHGLSPEWCKYIANEDPKRIVIANDADDAGATANKKTAENLEAAGIDPSIICIVDWKDRPKGFDLNDLVKSEGFPALEKFLDAAESWKPADPGLDLWDIDRLMNFTTPDHDNYLGDWLLSAGELALLVGPPDIGKSRVVNQLVFDILFGHQFWLETIPIHRNDLKIVIIQTENGARRLKRDFAAQLHGCSGAQRDVARKNLLFHVPSTVEDRDLGLDDPRNIDRLSKTVKRHKPDLVVLDPYGDLFAGDNENDAVQARQSVKAIFAVCQSYNPKTSILLIHHAKSGKGAAAQAIGWDTQTYARGSKALMSIARSQINIAPGDENSSYLVISCGKNNNGPKFDPFAVQLNQETLRYRRIVDWNLEQWKASVNARDGQQKKFEQSVDPSEILNRLPEDGSEIPTKGIVNEIMTWLDVSNKTVYRTLNSMAEMGMLRLRREVSGSVTRHFVQRM